MKIKFLLFAALVAGMSFMASADGLKFEKCGDILSTPDFTIKAGETATVPVSITRASTETTWKACQFNVVYPEGIKPAQNAKKKDVNNLLKDDDGETMVKFQCNPDLYPLNIFVGVNMDAYEYDHNPIKMVEIFVSCDADAKTGDVQLMYGNLKSIDGADDMYCSLTDNWGQGFDYQTGEKDVLCTIHIEGAAGPDAVNDLNVEAAKTYKTIENGQVVIVKNGVKYNTMGQAL